jgi:hypothetical protein
VSTGARATSHAAGLYRKAFNWIARPFRKLEDEVHHLEDVERAGQSAETPAFLGIFLFLLPIFILMLGLAFAAYYIAK